MNLATTETRTQAGVASRGLRAYIRLLRPRQWIKNGLVLAALLFSGKLLDLTSVAWSALAFAAFSLAASAVYCYNDAFDAERDALHPRKRLRPVAAGAVARPIAFLLAALLAGGGLLAAAYVDKRLGGVILLYLVINLLYSIWLKHMVFLDILAVASGFVLRALGGAFAISVPVSKWFLVVVMLLSLFLAVGKRRHEALTVSDAADHREVLAEYPIQLLDQLVGVLSGAVIVTYLLYALESHRPPLFALTGLPVIYGLFRYLYLVYRREEGGAPEETLLSDLPLLLAVGLWGVCSGAIIYFS
ncbi:MAG: decaprenyl-phosphate phosphoribosyltransferase [Bacillota bacterium]